MATDPNDQTPRQTARQELRAWYLKQLKDQKSVSAATLTEAATTAYGQDANFLARLFATELHEVLYREALAVISSTRGVFDVLISSAIGEEPTAIRQQRSRWETWLEHAGSRHVVIFDATKEDLLLASAERRGRADHEAALATLWDSLAAKLTKKQPRVRDRFSAEEIDALYENVRQSQSARGDAA